jgi:histone-lysine N-methyltransferase SETD3
MLTHPTVSQQTRTPHVLSSRAPLPLAKTAGVAFSDAGEAAHHDDGYSAAFQAWAAEGGVHLAGVAIAPVAVGGRGCVARHAIAAGELVLSVPGRLLLTCASAARDARMAAHAGTLRPEALLAAHLLHECSKGTDSPWHLYVRTLPRKYTDGGGFSPAEADALQAPHAVSAVTQLRYERRTDWGAARALLHSLVPPKLRSYAAWSWAASTVSSRTVFHPGSDAGALCPCGDAFNHDTPLSNAGLACGVGSYDAAQDAYCFHTHRDCAAGEQVFVSYGSHSNLALLSFYGFSLPCNAHDTALLPRCPVLTDLAVNDNDLHVGAADGAPSWRLLTALRLAAAPPALRRTRGHSAAAGEMLSLESEAAAFGRLRRACVAALAALPTAEDEDVVELRRIPPGTRLHLAVAWRAEYKAALRRAVCVADDTLAALAVAARDASGCQLVRAAVPAPKT